MSDAPHLLAAVGLGIALAAASGFRVFLPALVMAIAARADALPVELGENWQWVASDAALVTLAIATAVEIAAYYVPWVDNALDTIATPAAAVAGTLVTAAALSDFNPVFQWLTALIGGGGSATVVQTGSVLTRGLSSATTAGLANPLVSTTENAGSTLLAVLAIFLPILIGAAVLLFLVWLIHRLVYRRKRPMPDTPPPADAASP